MNKVLFVLHQKTSVPGDVGNKFRDRGYVAEICRPPLGEELPLNCFTFLLIVGPDLNNVVNFLNKFSSAIKITNQILFFYQLNCYLIIGSLSRQSL